MFRTSSSAAVLAAIGFAGCNDSAEPQPSPPSETRTITEPVINEAKPTAVPPRVTSDELAKNALVESTLSSLDYEILSSDRVPGVKRSLEVRLGGKVSEDVLRALARRLKSLDPAPYERTYIGYYLPKMKVGSGHWATTHFDPTLEVRVLGLTAEKEERLLQRSDVASRELLGIWIDETPYLGGRITIFREDGELKMEKWYKDGSIGTEKLVTKNTPTGKRFDKVGGSSFGDHWIIGAAGDLQIRDDEGLVSVARKVDP